MKVKRKSALISLDKIHSYFESPTYLNNKIEDDCSLSNSNFLHKIEKLSSNDESDSSISEVDDNEDVYDDSDTNDTNIPENISKVALKNCFKAIETAALLLRARNKNITSGLSLLQSHFVANSQYFNRILQSSYWADKILIDVDNKLDVFCLLSQAFFPRKEFMIDISKTNTKNKILSSLVSVSVVPTLNHKEVKHDLLPPMSSIIVHNPVADQHGVFINTGSFVKRMSWAPLNPELHCDQYLAITVFKELSERSHLYDVADGNGQMLQIYNCGQLKLSTRQAEPSRLEMVLTHDWGRVTDICWSPQPLPAVSRSRTLIGHLAMCCTDGFIRIIPISRLSRPGCLVTLDHNHPILCLGTTRNRSSQPVYPTTMHWHPQFPDKIVAGYNTGHVGLFVLESSVIASRAFIHGTDIHLKPSVFRRVFRSACRSIKISPYNWRFVACSSVLEEHTIVIDLDQPSECCLPSEVDIESTIGSRILWPAPGDIMVLATRKHLNNSRGLLLCSVQNPAAKAQKFLIPDISTIELCDSLNMIPVGTRQGQLRMLSLNTNHINELLRHLTRTSKDLSANNQLYHQYTVKPIANDERTDSMAATKAEFHTDSVVPCSCPPALKCVHKLIAKYSIMVDKDANTATSDWTLDAMLCINEIATNPNPASSTWIAVALECGLVHLVPLTHFYRSKLDRISTGSCCDALDETARGLLNEMMLPQTLSYFSKHGRRRKYAPGVNYSRIYRGMRKIYPLKSRPMKSDLFEQPIRNKVFDTVSVARRPATKTTRITDYFSSRVDAMSISNSIPQSTPKKAMKSAVKKAQSKSSCNTTNRGKPNSPVKDESRGKQSTRESLIRVPIPNRKRLKSRSSQTDETSLKTPTNKQRYIHLSVGSSQSRSRSTCAQQISGTENKCITTQVCESSAIGKTKRNSRKKIHSVEDLLEQEPEITNQETSKKTRTTRKVLVKMSRDMSYQAAKTDIQDNEGEAKISPRNSPRKKTQKNSIKLNLENSLDSVTRRLRASHPLETIDLGKIDVSKDWLSEKEERKQKSTINELSEQRMRLRSSGSREECLLSTKSKSSVHESLTNEKMHIKDLTTKHNDSVNHQTNITRLRLRSINASDCETSYKPLQSITNVMKKDNSIRMRLRSWGSHDDLEFSSNVDNPSDECLRDTGQQDLVKASPEDHLSNKESINAPDCEASYKQLESTKNVGKNDNSLQRHSESIRMRLRSWGCRDDLEFRSNIDNPSDESRRDTSQQALDKTSECRLLNKESVNNRSLGVSVAATIKMRLRSQDSQNNGESCLNNEPDNVIFSNDHISQSKLTKDPESSKEVRLEHMQSIESVDFNCPRKLRSCQSDQRGLTTHLINSEVLDNVTSNIEILRTEEPRVVTEINRNIGNVDDMSSQNKINDHVSKNKVIKKKTEKKIRPRKSWKDETILLEALNLNDETVKRKRLVSCESEDDELNISSQLDLSKNTHLRRESLNHMPLDDSFSKFDSPLLECSVQLTKGAFTIGETYLLTKESQRDSLLQNDCANNFDSVHKVTPMSAKSTRKRLHSRNSKEESWVHFTNSLKKAEIRKRWFPEKSSTQRKTSWGSSKRQKLSDGRPIRKRVTNTNVALIRKLFPNESPEDVLSSDSRKLDLSIRAGSNSPSFSCDDDVIELPELSDDHSHHQINLDHPITPEIKAVVTVPVTVFQNPHPVKITSQSRTGSVRCGHVTDIDGGYYDFDSEHVVDLTASDISNKLNFCFNPKNQSTPKTGKDPIGSLTVENEIENNMSIRDQTELSVSQKKEGSKKDQKERKSKIKDKKDIKRKDLLMPVYVKNGKKGKLEMQDKSVKEKSVKKSKNERIDNARLEKLHNIFAMKRQELFDSQSVISKTSWITQNRGPVDDIDVDLNKIDDISLGGNSSFNGSPRKKLNSSACVEDRMDKIKQVISRGLSQSTTIGTVLANDSPELLQPFRPVKPSRILTGSLQHNP